jgi:hypothetical protein
MDEYFTALFDAMGLPAGFREVVVPFAASQRTPTLEEVLTVWRAGVATQTVHPEASGTIATWCMSVAAYCPAVDVAPHLSDIKYEFGYLEQFVVVTSSEREAVKAWTALRDRVRILP